MSRKHHPEEPAVASPFPTSLSDYLETLDAFADEDRLSYLYSDFSPSRISNPIGYRGALDWWHKLLAGIISRGLQSGGGDADKLVFHADQGTIDRLRWKAVGKPFCLGLVLVSELSFGPLSRPEGRLQTELSQGDRRITPLDQFLKSPRPITQVPWSLAWLLARPVVWALRQLSVLDEESRDDPQKAWKRAQGDYVIIEVLDTAAKSVKASFDKTFGASTTDRLFSMASFKRHFADKALPNVTLTDLDFKVLLRYMQRDLAILIRDGDVIKFKGSVTESDSITEVDRGIVHVKEAVQQLEEQVERLEQRIEQCNAKASRYVSDKQTEPAKSQLRLKKQLLDVLSKRTKSLETTQTVLLKIETAAGDIQVMQAYSSATATLRGLLTHPSLANVDATLDEMADALADQREIESAIKIGSELATQTGDEVDEKDLEEELKLLTQEKEEEERAVREREAREEALGDENTRREEVLRGDEVPREKENARRETKASAESDTAEQAVSSKPNSEAEQKVTEEHSTPSKRAREAVLA